jgi:hypothetical protein
MFEKTKIMSLTDFTTDNCVMQSFRLLFAGLCWASLAWVSIPSSIWIHRDVRWLTKFRCRLTLDSCAVDSVDIRILAFGRKLVTQKGEKRGILIGHKLCGILKLIRQMSLLSRTVWSPNVTITDKTELRSVKFTEKSRYWTQLIGFVNLTDELIGLHLIRFSVTSKNYFGQQPEIPFRIINRPPKEPNLSVIDFLTWLSKH